MTRLLAYAIAFYLVLCTRVFAGVSCTLPFNLQNGITADASQVMANYNALVACLGNAAAAGQNGDITAINGLTTAILPAHGGTSRFYASIPSSGSANAQVVQTTVPPFILVNNYSVVFVSGFTNTGPTTLNVNNTGALNVFKLTPNGPAPLTGNEISTGSIAEVVFDGTEWQLITPGNENGGHGPWFPLQAATTSDFGTAPSHNIAILGGSSTISSFGNSASTTYPLYRFTMDGAGPTLVNSANLILPGNANIQSSNGDSGTALFLGGGVWRVLDYTFAAVGPYPGPPTVIALPFRTRQVFTTGAGATYTTPTSPAVPRQLFIREVGGGGGGGGSNTSGGNGANGTASVFSGISASFGNGGSGGGGPGAGGAGGAGGAAPLVTRFTGQNGGSGGSTNSPSVATSGGIAGGNGGASPLGSFGNGGAGCSGSWTSTINGQSGGGGGSGETVELIISNPNPTYLYTVGAGGGGGGCGSGGQNGIIIVDEYY